MSIACILAQLSQNIQTGVMVGLWQGDEVELPSYATSCLSSSCCREGNGAQRTAVLRDAEEGDQVELLDSRKV